MHITPDILPLVFAFGIFAHADAWFTAGTIGAPVLLLHGTADRIIPQPMHRGWPRTVRTAELRLCDGDSHFTIVTHAEEGFDAGRRVREERRPVFQ